MHVSAYMHVIIIDKRKATKNLEGEQGKVYGRTWRKGKGEML